MRICTLDSASTITALQALLAGTDVLWASLEEELCEYEALSDNSLKELATKCQLILRPNDGSKPPTGKLADQVLVSTIHEGLPINARIAANNGFWRWVSAKYFFEVVQERHGKPDLLANHANFGTKGKLESLIGRVWFRGEIAINDTDDEPYALACRGDQDFWRSHVLRKRYGNSRSFVRSLIAYQYPEGNNQPTLDPSGEGGIRSLTKRIQATHASRAIELLEDDSANILLTQLSQGLTPSPTTKPSNKKVNKKKAARATKKLKSKRKTKSKGK